MMESRGLTLAAVGDLVPTRRLFRDGVPASQNLSAIQRLLGTADVVFGDLEAPLATTGMPREKLITFRADPAIGADLRQLGFDVLSLANNHSMDYGEQALLETVKVLASHQIRTVGAGRDLAQATAPVVLEVGGWRVGFLAWSCLLPVGSAAGPRRAGHAPIHIRTAFETDPYFQMEEPGHPPRVRTWPDAADLQAAEETIHGLRDRVDLVVVSLHMGFGFGAELAEYEPLVSHALIDAGADIVLGNHVHAIHAVERYQGKAILYSPGNFISQQPREGEPQVVLDVYEQMSPDGYVAYFDVATNRGYQLRLIPMTTDEDGLPVLATGEVFARIARRLKELSRDMNTTVTIEGDHVEVELSDST